MELSKNLEQFIRNKLLTPQGIFFVVLIVYIPLFFYFFYFDNTQYASFAIRSGSDGPAYAALAQNLIHRHIFSSDTIPPFLPDTFRTPGYPLFVAAILLLTNSFVAVSVIQIILTALTAALLYMIARSMIPKPLAYAVGLLYGLGLNTITLSINLMSEVPFIFLVVLSIYLLFFSGRPHRRTLVLGAGLMLGAAILIRPIGLFLPVLYVLFYAIIYRGLGLKTILRNTGLIVAGCIIILAPWMARNARLTGHLSLTSVGMYDVLFYNVDYFLADSRHVSPTAIETELKKETGITDNQYGELSNSDRISSVALSYLKKYPFQYLRYHLLKEAEVFGQSGLAYFLNEAPRLKLALNRLGLVDIHGPNISQLFTRGEYGKVFAAMKTQSLSFLDRFFWLCVSLLMLAPFIINRKEFFWQKLFFLSLVLYLPFLSAPIGDVRYRVPAEPFMFILAVWGLWIIYRHLMLSRLRH